jgi:hypothetical protein
MGLQGKGRGDHKGRRNQELLSSALFQRIFLPWLNTPNRITFYQKLRRVSPGYATAQDLERAIDWRAFQGPVTGEDASRRILIILLS